MFTTTTRRAWTASALAAGAFSVLAVSTPANAEPDPGSPYTEPHPSQPHSLQDRLGEARGDDAPNGQARSPGSSDNLEPTQPASPPAFVPDDGIEVVPMGLGALTGAAIGAAAYAGISSVRHRKHTPHPA